jgi:hypothetical protein
MGMEQVNTATRIAQAAAAGNIYSLFRAILLTGHLFKHFVCTPESCNMKAKTETQPRKKMLLQLHIR